MSGLVVLVVEFKLDDVEREMTLENKGPSSNGARLVISWGKEVRPIQGTTQNRYLILAFENPHVKTVCLLPDLPLRNHELRTVLQPIA